MFAHKGDNQKPALVRQFAEAYLVIADSELEKTWNSGLPLLNRLLWANLESLPSDLFEKIVQRLTSERYLLLADHKKLERVHYLNSKRLTPINLISRLKELGDKSVHNAYHHEVLAFAISRKDSALKRFFEVRLASLENQMNTLEIS
jgi:hypothetical protein